MDRIAEETYVEILAGLLSRDKDARRRTQHVREANRRLYQTLVSGSATSTQADLALAKAVALGERQ